MEWNGKIANSSMLRLPVPGPLVVHKDHIEGNSFGSPLHHGIEHSVLYALGLKSANTFFSSIGRNSYEPGSMGENVTLDDLDETQISVGDLFQFGEVLAQATWPRTPCGKVNIRAQHDEAQKAMQASGRSGVYFRVLKPGKIHLTDSVVRVERSSHPVLISDLYRNLVAGFQPSAEEIALFKANGAFPKKMMEKWSTV